MLELPGVESIKVSVVFPHGRHLQPGGPFHGPCLKASGCRLILTRAEGASRELLQRLQRPFEGPS